MQIITKKMIAPCGIDCGICQHFLRKENNCPGCFTGRKLNGRIIKCGRRNCKERYGDFCFECAKFPCDSIKRLDLRYREKYGISDIENLKTIQSKGIDKFVKSEREKWQSKKGTLCVHDKQYYL